jgi:3-(methylsulfanyl)propanoyl-CoA dehydrogenase
MSSYRAPIKDMKFVLEVIAEIDGMQKMPGFEEATSETVAAILEEAGRQASEIVAPTNRIGDIEGCKWSEDGVTTPDCFKEAYNEYAKAGWLGLDASVDHGGQGLPFALQASVLECFLGGNSALFLGPFLTMGTIFCLTSHGSIEQQQAIIPKLLTGEWTGAMVLTEPQAGTDIGAVKTKATANSDGSYSIKGTKIFISWGDHDLSDNIIHIVLARTPDGPPGTKGISMFMVPKFRFDDAGKIGAANDVKCVSLEHKLGIHGSPTCVMSYGDNDDCRGWLVGNEFDGMANMFTMMNQARVNVGIQGIGIAEGAYQHAASYAKERGQGRAIGHEGVGPHAIIHHADVRRMLMSMRAKTEAARAIVCLNAAAIDKAHAHPDAAVRNTWQGLAALLTPISKSFGADVAVEVASEGIQVHGGMGFIEETGAAQFYRDARILPIYEGTNGVQAMDLVGRKLNLDGGAHWRLFLKSIGEFSESLPADGQLGDLRRVLEDSVVALHDAAERLVKMGASNPRGLAAGASAFQRMFGLTTGAFLLGRCAVEAQRRLDAGDKDEIFLKNKIATACFYAEQILPASISLYGPATAGDALVFSIDDSDL